MGNATSTIEDRPRAYGASFGTTPAAQATGSGPYAWSSPATVPDAYASAPPLPPGDAARQAWEPAPPAPGGGAVAAAPPAWQPQPAAAPHYDIELVVDDSYSMHTVWDQTCEGVQALLQAALERDADGVEVSFFNHRDGGPGGVRCVRDGGDVTELFRNVRPSGMTPTADALQRVLDRFWHGRPQGNGPRSVVVVTDGQPDDFPAVCDVIVGAARRLEAVGAPADHLGFSFVGVGPQVRPGTQAYAQLKFLDDGLPEQYRVRDIVDCSALIDPRGGPLKDRLPKLLLGGNDARLDAQAGL